MATAFISYSVKDEHLAKSLHTMISMAGIDTFLAGISITPGANWTDAIFKHLDEAKWVFFLATKNSIGSAAVQQELGASLIQEKNIIPILIDVNPEELPGWIGNHQAIDINSDPELLHQKIEAIAEKIQVDKFWAGVIVGAIIVGLGVLIAKSK